MFQHGCQDSAHRLMMVRHSGSMQMQNDWDVVIALRNNCHSLHLLALLSLLHELVDRMESV